MIKKTNYLPYFNTQKENIPKHSKITNEKEMARFLVKKFKPAIREKMPLHYLVESRVDKKIKFIKEKKQNYRYFLRFDIRRYFPSVIHTTLLKELPAIYEQVIRKKPSRQFTKYEKKDIPRFLSKAPYGQGLSIGSALSFALAGIFLLKLDFRIDNPLLRQTDDYLIFCKKKADPENILKDIVMPTLQKLHLSLNNEKIASGKFHQCKVDYIGFDYYAGHFSVNESKINKFKKNVIAITKIDKNKSKKATIKQLNRKIRGFGHYYKHSSCTQLFKELDKFIRSRLRYFLLAKRNKSNSSNLFISNEALSALNLNSLADIKAKFDKKNKKNKNKKSSPKKPKICQVSRSDIWQDNDLRGHIYEQKLILAKLEELTKKINRMEKSVNKIKKIGNY